MTFTVAICPVCGLEFERERNLTCSEKCARILKRKKFLNTWDQKRKKLTS